MHVVCVHIAKLQAPTPPFLLPSPPLCVRAGRTCQAAPTCWCGRQWALAGAAAGEVAARAAAEAAAGEAGERAHCVLGRDVGGGVAVPEF